MCYFKRLIYTCSHPLFVGPEPIRKCRMQLAYENGDVDTPCGKTLPHSYVSLKIDGACGKCGRTSGTLSRVREQLREARLRLRIPEEDENDVRGRGRGRREEEDNDEEEEEEDSDEGLSPVDLNLCRVVGLETVKNYRHSVGVDEARESTISDALFNYHRNGGRL